MDKSLKAKLSILYSEILRGYSVRHLKPFGDFYIQHFSQLDSSGVEEKREEYFQKAISVGIPTEEESIELNIREGLWSKEKEREIVDLKMSLSRAQETKNKLTLKSQKIQFDRKIKDYQSKLEEIQFERYELFGLTAENFAAKKMNEYYIFKAAKSDETLSKTFFSEEDFNDLEDPQVDSLAALYAEFMSDFSPENLKRIALSIPFMDIFNLCNDNARELFGRPIYQLTFFQREIFATARYFKNVLSESKYKPSLDMYEDPDQLIEWMGSGSTGSQSRDDSDREGATSYVGATQEDLKGLGVDTSDSISLSKEAAKKGGSLDMRDIMRLHGLKV